MNVLNHLPGNILVEKLAGEFTIVNKYLVEELIKLGLWNEDIKNNIILNKGSGSIYSRFI